MPMLRAVAPETTRKALRLEVAFMSLFFIFHDVHHLFAGDLADLVSFVRHFELAVMPAAFFEKIEAGGDLADEGERLV